MFCSELFREMPNQPTIMIVSTVNGADVFLQLLTKLWYLLETESHFSIFKIFDFFLSKQSYYEFIFLLSIGIALIQCVFIYSLSETSYTNFLENYHKLAQPFQSVYYSLLAICTVSVADRYVFREFFFPCVTSLPMNSASFFVALLVICTVSTATPNKSHQPCIFYISVASYTQLYRSVLHYF